MDNAKLMLPDNVSPPVPLEPLNKIVGASEEKKKQFCKDFESVLIHKLLDEMKNTIGDWGFEKDGDSKQVQDIFWLYLAQTIADKGGLGMWKDIYRVLSKSEQATTSIESLGKDV